MNYDEMIPGAEMDALVAKVIFGCDSYVKGMGWDEDGGPYWAFCGCENQDHQNWESHHSTMYHYSEDMSAWDIVEAFRRGTAGHVAACISIHVTDSPTKRDICVAIYGPDIAQVEACAMDAPEAICLAGLKALGENDEH